jgi:phosphomannomutase
MSIFRAYDIRGIYGKDLTEDVMERIGNGAANYIKRDAIIASDARPSSPFLKNAFISGWICAGYNITDIGYVPLGVACFASWKAKKPLAFITASHLTSEWNGVKFFHSNGVGFLENELKEIERRTKKLKISKKGTIKNVNSEKVIKNYIEYLLGKIKPVKKLKIVLDPGNGMASLVAEKLFKMAGFDVNVINGKLDCRFPNRKPDPFEDNLEKLKSCVEEIGIAYDGDGDRMVIVDKKKRKLSPEQVAAIILPELLKSESGPVIANVECTMAIDKISKQFGKNVIRVKVGHTWLMEGVKKYKASFGLEPSGHYVLPSLMPFDDALAISYWLSCVLSKKDKSLDRIVDEIKIIPFERFALECSDDIKFSVIEKLKDILKKNYKNINTMDGVRVELDRGWALIRASNTSPIIRLTVEAESNSELEKIKNIFLNLIKDAIAGKL